MTVQEKKEWMQSLDACNTHGFSLTLSTPWGDTCTVSCELLLWQFKDMLTVRYAELERQSRTAPHESARQAFWEMINNFRIAETQPISHPDPTELREVRESAD